MLNYFTLSEASSILAIKPGRLRYWDRIGLVKPSIRGKKTCYNFQDLICLRTAQGLVAKGLPATRIKKSVDSLRHRFPGLGNHLADKRVYVFGNRVVISHQNRLIDSQSGQLLLRFDVADLARDVENRVASIEAKKTAEDWFAEGLRYDSEPRTYARAAHAYRQALKLDPSFLDAQVNLGNIYYREGRYVDAQRCYRLALSRDPYHATAYFNLGNVLDELDCLDEAIHCYEKALEVDPNFPDVYYNLAAACEKAAAFARAVKYWKGYLHFDSSSRHADFARQRIHLLHSETTSQERA